jgi:hypothetical protein
MQKETGGQSVELIELYISKIQIDHFGERIFQITYGVLLRWKIRPNPAWPNLA